MEAEREILWEVYQETCKFLRFIQDNYRPEDNQEFDDLVYALNEFIEYGFDALPEDCEQ